MKKNAKLPSMGVGFNKYKHAIHHGELVPGAKIPSDKITKEKQNLVAKKGTDAAIKSLMNRKNK